MPKEHTDAKEQRIFKKCIRGIKISALNHTCIDFLPSKATVLQLSFRDEKA